MLPDSCEARKQCVFSFQAVRFGAMNSSEHEVCGDVDISTKGVRKRKVP